MSVHWIDGLQWGIVLGLVGSGIAALVVTTGQRDIQPIETFQLSWTTLTKSLMSQQALRKGLVGGAIGAVGAGVCAGLTHVSILEGGLLGLVWGLVFGLVLGMSADLAGTEIETKTIPNQGIWRSLLNAVWVGLSFGLIITLLGVLGFMLMGLSSTCQWISAPLILLGFGGLGMVVNPAGKACLQHLTLRLVLWSQGIIPWNYARFLNSAVEDIFLQRAGGTYFFMHRMLLEHFARMESKGK